MSGERISLETLQKLLKEVSYTLDSKDLNAVDNTLDSKDKPDPGIEVEKKEPDPGLKVRASALRETRKTLSLLNTEAVAKFENDRDKYLAKLSASFQPFIDLGFLKKDIPYVHYFHFMVVDDESGVRLTNQALLKRSFAELALEKFWNPEIEKNHKANDGCSGEGCVYCKTLTDLQKKVLELLKFEFVKVTEFSDGVTAFEYFKQNSANIDGIHSDQNMPQDLPRKEKFFWVSDTLTEKDKLSNNNSEIKLKIQYLKTTRKECRLVTWDKKVSVTLEQNIFEFNANKKYYPVPPPPDIKNSAPFTEITQPELELLAKESLIFKEKIEASTDGLGLINNVRNYEGRNKILTPTLIILTTGDVITENECPYLYDENVKNDEKDVKKNHYLSGKEDEKKINYLPKGKNNADNIKAILKATPSIEKKWTQEKISKELHSQLTASPLQLAASPQQGSPSLNSPYNNFSSNNVSSPPVNPPNSPRSTVNSNTQPNSPRGGRISFPASPSSEGSSVSEASEGSSISESSEQGLAEGSPQQNQPGQENSANQVGSFVIPTNSAILKIMKIQQNPNNNNFAEGFMPAPHSESTAMTNKNQSIQKPAVVNSGTKRSAPKKTATKASKKPKTENTKKQNVRNFSSNNNNEPSNFSNLKNNSFLARRGKSSPLKIQQLKNEPQKTSSNPVNLSNTNEEQKQLYRTAARRLSEPLQNPNDLSFANEEQRQLYRAAARRLSGPILPSGSPSNANEEQKKEKQKKEEQERLNRAAARRLSGLLEVPSVTNIDKPKQTASEKEFEDLRPSKIGKTS